MNKSPQPNAAKRYRLVLSAVHMVYRLVNSTFTVQELTLRLTRLLCQFIHASSAKVYLLDSNKSRVIMMASFDNQINILHDKPFQLRDVSLEVMAVTRGASLFTDHCLALPLIADDYLGAIIVRRKEGDAAFNNFDREMLSVFAEQVVTAIKNLQLTHEREEVILGSIQSIGQLLSRQKHLGITHAPAFVEIVKQLARQLRVGQDGIKQLEYASLLHDIGVIDIPYEVLSKREKLSTEEFKIIRNHTLRSVEFIKPVAFLKPVLPIILYHHERFDGSGYPAGLKKEQIPFGARIISVVDAFESMVQQRPYRKQFTVEESLNQLRVNSGTQFDPKVVDAFLHLAKQKKFKKFLSLLVA